MSFEKETTRRTYVAYATLANVLSGIVAIIAALVLLSSSPLFAQETSMQVFLPLVTNLATTEQDISQAIEVDFESLEAHLTSQQAENVELPALGTDIGCVHPFTLYGVRVAESIRLGDRGINVRLAQQLIMNRHNRNLAPYGVDGHFGNTTRNAITEIQQHWRNQNRTACGRAIGVDGTVGPQTWAILIYQHTPVKTDLNFAQRKRFILETFSSRYPNDKATISLLLAIAARESGQTLSNDPNDLRPFCRCHNTDGIMQVTNASGFKRGNYDNTNAGIRRNLEDGLNVFEEFGGTRNRIRTAWKYNGGTNPFATYAKGQGDPNYIGNLANELENFVAAQFPEYANQQLVNNLRAAQAKIRGGQAP